VEISKFTLDQQSSFYLIMHRRALSSPQRIGSYDSPSAAQPNRNSYPKQRRRRKVKSSRRNRSIFQSTEGDPVVMLFMVFSAVVVVVVLVLLGFLGKLLYSRFWSNPGTNEHTPSSSTYSKNKEFETLESSKIYSIPHSMLHIGDKSDEYATVRKEYDERHSYDPERSLQITKGLATLQFTAISNPSYDIRNCPKKPPEGYPYQWKTLDIVNRWNPNDPNPPTEIYQGLCIFDYRQDYVKILKYRQQELPFVVRGDPEVAAVVERWNSPEYLSKMLAEKQHRVEYSENNQFMFWVNRKKQPPPEGWKQPTTMMKMSYQEWLSRANVTDDKLGTDKPHWYYRLIGCGEIGQHGECDEEASEYLFDELTFFQPRPTLYIIDPHQQRGIHCRFGMKGVIAENHFDGSRNSIAVLGGSRRYILSHPDQCLNLDLFPKGHPSARHSAVDWSNPDLEKYPNFVNALSNEVVLQAGDVLYLPQHWFHFIVSLSLNFQCNTRSGKSPEYEEPIHDCGF
jgi:hypothetical protein